MQIENDKDVQLEIANQYELAFPCIKQALKSKNTLSEIKVIQHRLLTYKEILLHQNMLNENELKNAFSALKPSEKRTVQAGIKTIDDTVKEIDDIIEKYSRKVILTLS
ncbi:hypothetical protein ACFFUO_10725 [Vibrio artabrorum]|uniref:Uncharacterized protein n=1 Tax=Vibrio artabrorum TaxID=446374 RepID=A0ABT8CL01_9VIBR|nr:hypothetical protein [Vibrio artabrorum]MDN3702174.1 hypothetical protein [Vibrio artabrorum]